jgi:HPt (histidine-containing phosphotransfer) domain-containing protein
MKYLMHKATLYEKVLRDFHARFRNQSQLISAALADGDIETARRYAHSTKGLAATIGATALNAAAYYLEQQLTKREHAESALKHFDSELHTVIQGIASGFGITDDE